MSISPKILNRNEDKFTVFHMKIVNNSDENIEGYICYKVTMPNGKMDIKTFNRIERVNAHSELNLYDKYYINKNFLIGRYYVEGRFFWNDQNILSETNENDYFDIKENL